MWIRFSFVYVFACLKHEYTTRLYLLAVFSFPYTFQMMFLSAKGSLSFLTRLYLSTSTFHNVIIDPFMIIYHTEEFVGNMKNYSYVDETIFHIIAINELFLNIPKFQDFAPRSIQMSILRGSTAANSITKSWTVQAGISFVTQVSF